jgi:hypothetical protein
MKTVLFTALLATLVALSAQASEVETGTVMICDTQKQAERLGQVFDGKPEAAISTVNLEVSDPNACGLANVAYVQGKLLGTVRSKSQAFHVVPIIVVGVNTPFGLRPVNSVVYFTLVKVEELSA